MSTPLINSLTLATVHEPRFAQLGVFGYCVDNTCSRSSLGYDLTRLTSYLSVGKSLQGDGVIDGFTDTAAKSLTAVTKGFILHPIAGCLAFLAMIVACAADKIGYLFASILTLLAFLASLAAMLIDFVAFAMVKNHVGDAGGSASYGGATWMTLVATILLLIAMSTAMISCCCGRSSKHKQRAREAREREAMHHPNEKRKFWQRGTPAHHGAAYDPNGATYDPHAATYDHNGATHNPNMTTNGKSEFFLLTQRNADRKVSRPSSLSGRGRPETTLPSCRTLYQLTSCFFNDDDVHIKPSPPPPPPSPPLGVNIYGDNST